MVIGAGEMGNRRSCKRQPGHHVTLLSLLLYTMLLVSFCHARPQNFPRVSPFGSFTTEDRWRPVVRSEETSSDAQGDTALPPHRGVRIDENPSRVRIEDMDRVGRETNSTTPIPTGSSVSSTKPAGTAATTTVTTPTASTTTKAPSTNKPVPSTTQQAGNSQLGASIHKVTSQLLSSVEDVRTPPKLRDQQETRSGQGVAVPVLLEEDELENPEEVLTRKTSTSKPGGISTWVLLSGSGDATIPTTAKPAKTTPRPTTAPSTTTTKKPKPATTTTRKPATTTTRKPLATTAKPTPTTTKPKVPVPAKNKTSNFNTSIIPAMTRKPPTTLQKSTTTTTTTTTPTSTTTTTTTEVPLVTTVQMETTSEDVEDTENITETTTRRTRRPGTGSKKKKKNKNKRRKNRPSNSTAVAESKIGEEGNSTKPTQNKERPLSTRIYNYLAREVMPSFGVGLLGLAITAGLAGLIMYPFGGGTPLRRTYDTADAPSLPPHGNFYYYGGEGYEDDGGQAEESVIRKVFEGMNTEPQSESSQTSTKYQTQEQSNPQEEDAKVASGQVTTYAGDVQARYPSHRYDTSQAYAPPSNTRQESFYNPEQAVKYYSTSNNRTEPQSARVRYRDVATGAVMDSQPTQQITKKSEYYAYNTGRVRSHGDLQSENLAPRVRFREVGSDRIRYTMDESSDQEFERGPRRSKRQAWSIDNTAFNEVLEDNIVKNSPEEQKEPQTTSSSPDVTTSELPTEQPETTTDIATEETVVTTDSPQTTTVQDTTTEPEEEGKVTPNIETTTLPPVITSKPFNFTQFVQDLFALKKRVTQNILSWKARFLVGIFDAVQRNFENSFRDLQTPKKKRGALWGYLRSKRDTRGKTHPKDSRGSG